VWKFLISRFPKEAHRGWLYGLTVPHSHLILAGNLTRILAKGK